jgi:hypothetical protein
MTETNNQRLILIEQARTKYHLGELTKDEYKAILYKHLAEIKSNQLLSGT